MSDTDQGQERAGQAPDSPAAPAAEATAAGGDGDGGGGARRRGSRGGRNRRPGTTAGPEQDGSGDDREPDELPDRLTRNTIQDPAVAEQALVRKPQIGDTRPAPAAPPATDGGAGGAGGNGSASGEAKQRSGSGRRRRGGRGRGRGGQGGGGQGSGGQGGSSQGGGAKAEVRPVQAIMPTEALELDESELVQQRGRERKGKPVGRYLMVVSKRDQATQIAVLEGRNLVEHYVSRPADDVFQIHGNIYLGRVQNVLPGMEAAFVDIGTPKNAVLYRGDVQYDKEDIDEPGEPKIEQILKARQNVLCQVTKNPIAHKGARLTQEVSLPGRFVVLIPNSKTYGISKRLPDDERKRLRQLLDRVKPAEHGVIVRTAAEGVSTEEIERDVRQLLEQWRQIEHLASTVKAPALLYREPDMAVRVIREEFSRDHRGVVIDDRELFEEVHAYVSAITPALADRVELYDTSAEPLSVFERYHVHDQLHRALDRKVWLPSGGSLIIEHTEALTVIDVNTGKNVGTSSLEETVYRNNLEAAEEIAKQLRLRDIGGIIVCDFIDMEIAENRKAVIKAFREALARDKTRTQVFDISALGLVEMTRKRIGEGLLESLSSTCPECEGRGVVLDTTVIEGI